MAFVVRALVAGGQGFCNIKVFVLLIAVYLRARWRVARPSRYMISSVPCLLGGVERRAGQHLDPLARLGRPPPQRLSTRLGKAHAKRSRYEVMHVFKRRAQTHLRFDVSVELACRS